MDKAQEKLQQFRQKYQQQATQTNQQQPQVTNNDKQVDANIAEQLAELKKQVSEVKKNNDELEKANERLTKQRDEQSKNVKDSLDEQAMGDVMTGFSQKFEKDYDFPVEGQDDLKFKIVMHPMYAFDMVKIRNMTVQLTDSLFKGYDSDTAFFVESLAAIKILGDDVPTWLTDIEHLIRWDIPQTIYEDYLEWLSTFRESKKH